MTPNFWTLSEFRWRLGLLDISTVRFKCWNGMFDWMSGVPGEFLPVYREMWAESMTSYFSPGRNGRHWDRGDRTDMSRQTRGRESTRCKWAEYSTFLNSGHSKRYTIFSHSPVYAHIHTPMAVSTTQGDSSQGEVSYSGTPRHSCNLVSHMPPVMC